jgi:hypothetical protein
MARNPTHWLGTLGGVLAAVAPKGLCPICVAASGGVLSSVGLGFLAVDSVLRWVLASVLLVGLIGLYLSMRRHGRWEAIAVGVAGSVVLYTGWLMDTKPVLYGGMAVLLAASALNLWSQRHPRVPLVQLRRVRHGQA